MSSMQLFWWTEYQYQELYAYASSLQEMPNGSAERRNISARTRYYDEHRGLTGGDTKLSMVPVVYKTEE